MVDVEGDVIVWWCVEMQCVEQEVEFVFGFFGIDVEQFEYCVLYV